MSARLVTRARRTCGPPSGHRSGFGQGSTWSHGAEGVARSVDRGAFQRARLQAQGPDFRPGVDGPHHTHTACTPTFEVTCPLDSVAPRCYSCSYPSSSPRSLWLAPRRPRRGLRERKPPRWATAASSRRASLAATYDILDPSLVAPWSTTDVGVELWGDGSWACRRTRGRSRGSSTRRSPGYPPPGRRFDTGRDDDLDTRHRGG